MLCFIVIINSSCWSCSLKHGMKIFNHLTLLISDYFLYLLILADGEKRGNYVAEREDWCRYVHGKPPKDWWRFYLIIPYGMSSCKVGIYREATLGSTLAYRLHQVDSFHQCWEMRTIYWQLTVYKIACIIISVGRAGRWS